jgi:endonuclease YncB( thermonuclease family)
LAKKGWGRKIAALEPFSTVLGEGTLLSVCCVRHSFAIASAAIACAAAITPARAEISISSCPEAHAAGETVQAAAARDGATLRLQDGREVRLAGVIAATELDGDRAAAIRATEDLNTRIAGKALTLFGQAGADRYGRLIAQVAIGDTGWLQADLVSGGSLRVAPESSEISCARPLLGLEAKARTAGRGLWHEAAFGIEQAGNLDSLTQNLGRFAVVEGVIARVGETKSRTYLDFGRRYNRDFSIMIPRSARAGFAAAGIDLKYLRGKHVRVRGVLFSSGGPAIEIRKPASLEILGDGT